MKDINSAQDFKRPSAGGYVLKIERVENNTSKERLELYFDIAEGEFKGYIKETHDKFGFWSATAFKSYKAKALPFFRKFVEAVVESNANTDGLVVGDFEDVDETKLKGLLVGAAVGEREYDSIDGQRKKVLDWYNAKFCPADDIRNGNFTVPPLRDSTTKPGGVTDANTEGIKVTDASMEFGPVDDKDIPF